MDKIVNGEVVEMTPAEVAARLAEEAAWAARHIPTNDEIDIAELNRALAEEGSLMRAVVAVLRSEINIVRAAVVPALPPRTVAQVTAALKAQMRT
jgi:hypothetical protein